MARTDLPAPIAVTLSFARSTSHDPLTRLKAHCDLAENTARLFAAILVAECRRKGVTSTTLASDVQRIRSGGLQFGNWIALLEAGRKTLKSTRDLAVPEVVSRAWAWGGRQTGYLDFLKRMLRIRNALHHSLLAYDQRTVQEHLAEATRCVENLLETTDFLAGYRLVAYDAVPEFPGVTDWSGSDSTMTPGVPDGLPQPAKPGTYLLGGRSPLPLDPMLVTSLCPECGKYSLLSLDRRGAGAPTTFISLLCPHRVDLPEQNAAVEELMAWSAGVVAPLPAAASVGVAQPQAPAAKKAPAPSRLPRDRKGIVALVTETLGPAAAEQFAPLDKDQLDAVTHVEGPSMVLAAAGTGKTRVLACRAAWLASAGVPAESILAVTFTNKAAREMRERLDLMWGRTSPVHVSTVHATCAALLREQPPDADGKGLASLGIADAPTTGELLNLALDDVLGTRGIRLDERARDSIRRAIDRTKEALGGPEQLRAMRGRLATADLAADTCQAYQERLAAEGLMDFNDLIIHACHLLREEPDVLARCRDRWQWILVDEYQDLNDGQITWLKLLRGDSPRFLAAGDDDQMIYGWRGARAGRIQALLDEPGMRKVVLGTNFRSTRQILGVAKGVIERNRKRVVKQMSFGFAAEGEPAIIHEARNEPDEAQWVATRIEEWADRQAEQGTDELARPKYRCQAVLARSGRLLDAVGEALKQRGIPYRLMTNRGYLEDRAVKAILAACRCAVSPARPFALMMTLRCFFPGLTRSRLRSVAETAAAAPDWADTDRTASGVEGAGAKGSAPPSLLEGVPAEVGNVLAVIKQVMDYPAGPDCATKAVDALLPLVRVHPEADEPHEHDPSALDDLLLAALEYDQRAGQSGSVIDFLGSLALQSNDPDIRPDGDEVRLMTLHSAKGLEFEAVYLIGVREWIVPLLLPGGPLDPRTDDDQLEEERRLFYVGMTRASRKLVVTWPEMNVTRAGGVARSVRSRFLAELGEPVRWV